MLGHLSWTAVLEDKSVNIALIVPGRIRKFNGLTLVNPVGKELRGKIELVNFYIGTKPVSISDIYYQLSEFVRSAEEYFMSERFNYRDA